MIYKFFTYNKIKYSPYELKIIMGAKSRRSLDIKGTETIALFYWASHTRVASRLVMGNNTCVVYLDKARPRYLCPLSLALRILRGSYL